MSLFEVLGEEFLAIEDKRVHKAIEKHNDILKQINQLNPDEIPSHCAKAQYLYFQAQFYAYTIAGYYKNRYKYYEGKAEQAQADEYEKVRVEGFGGEKSGTGTDSQYLSRKAKGEQLITAAKYEGDFVRWSGIAKSYDNAINALKDMLKTLKAEEKGGVA